MNILLHSWTLCGYIEPSWSKRTSGASEPKSGCFAQRAFASAILSNCVTFTCREKQVLHFGCVPSLSCYSYCIILFLCKALYVCFSIFYWDSFILQRKLLYHGLRTPNEDINQRYLRNWANVADKICFGRAVPKNLGLGLTFRPCSEGCFLSGRP